MVRTFCDICGEEIVKQSRVPFYNKTLGKLAVTILVTGDIEACNACVEAVLLQGEIEGGSPRKIDNPKKVPENKLFIELWGKTLENLQSRFG